MTDEERDGQSHESDPYVILCVSGGGGTKRLITGEIIKVYFNIIGTLSVLYIF